MKIPEKISLANLPTPIHSFKNLLPKDSAVNLYIKRDDFTGMEMSGNKVRKLEYALCQGLSQGAEVFITCGGIQSNHCRATAAAAVQLEKKAHLVLRGEAGGIPEGNLLLDHFFGGEITYITPEQYKKSRGEIMAGIKEEYEKKGIPAYILPEGASNGIGLFGYYNAYEEILAQEKELGFTFDTICLTEGSGGTYAGLYAANEIHGHGRDKKIVGFNIYDKDANVEAEIIPIIEEGLTIAEYEGKISYDNIHIINDYAGEGYGLTPPEAVAFIREGALKTGVVLDPVYTGKTMYGLCKEIQKGNPLFKGNVLFIHTGGLFGLFAKKELFFSV